MNFERKTMLVDGLVTSYLEAGEGDPLVMLHGGEFGASAELGWERNIAALAERHRVLAPDQLGFGQSAKVIDFVDGRGMRIRHVARFCEVLGIESAHFAGNSMGAINLLVDTTSETPLLPVRSLAIICGGGQIQQNQHFEALQQYDATLPAMRRIVEALFYGPGYPDDEDYVRRRYDSSIAPGAWEAVAAARFRRPDAAPFASPSTRTRLRTHRSADAGRRRRRRQTASRRLGRRDRRADRGRAFGGGRRCRPLPADRAVAVVNELLLDFYATAPQAQNT